MYDDVFHATNRTAGSGTEILVLIPGGGGRRKRLSTAQYRCAGTVHTLSVMRPAADTTASALAVATATTIVLTSITRLGANIGANDYVAWKDANGTWHSRKVSSINTGTKTITVAALTTDLPAGTTVYLFGAVGSVHNRSLPCTASVVNTYTDRETGIFETGIDEVASAVRYQRSGNGDPILLSSDNATAAGNFELVTAGCGSIG